MRLVLTESKAVRPPAGQQDAQLAEHPYQQVLDGNGTETSPPDDVSVDADSSAAESNFTQMSIAELLQLDLVLPEGADAGNDTLPVTDGVVDLMELSLLELMEVRAIPAELPELPDLAPRDMVLQLPDDDLDHAPPSHLFPEGGLIPIGVLPGTDSTPPPQPPPPPPDPTINVAPDARNDSYTVLEDALLSRSSVTGVLLNDVDGNGDKLTVSLISGPANGKLVLNSNGSFTYDSNTDFNGKDSFTYQVNDGRGGTDTATVFINVTPGNDAPTIVAGSTTTTGSAGELADGDADENGIAHKASGTIAFADVDVPNTHSASVVPQGSGYLGSLVLGTVNQVGDTVDWNFSVADSALDLLADGETRTQTYNIIINDKSGGTVTQAVTITLTGANDALTILGGTTATGSVTEIADKAVGENTTTSSEAGTIFFDDVDAADTHSAAFAPQAGGYVGSLTLGAVNQITDRVGWTFSVDDAELDYLGAGEVLTQSYDVTIDDGHGGTATQAVTITLTGANDAPTIETGSTTDSGSVTERFDGAPDENSVTHEASGTIAFSDVDLSDVHSAMATPDGAGYFGTLTLGAVDQSGKTVDWTFSVDDSDLDSLADGTVLTQTYTVSISDGRGGTAVQVITVTIIGTNDAPSVAALAAGGSIDENGLDGTVVGTVVADDPDSGDSLTYSLSDDAGGRFAIDSTTGVITVADGSRLDFESDTGHSITVVASDGSAKTSSTLNIAVNDANEVPTLVTLSNASVDENDDGAIVGLLTVDDPDAGDSHSFTLSDARFEVVSGQLKLIAGNSLDYETESSVTIDVTATDSGGLDRVETFIIIVNNVVEPLFTAGDDAVDFNSIVDGQYVAGTEHDALGGNDNVILPIDSAAATAAGYDPLTPFNAGKGDDSVTGGDLDDWIAGGSGADSLSGGGGNDVFEWDASDAAIDGGSDTDTLFSDIGDVNLTTAGVSLSNIEIIDLGVGVGSNTLTLTAADVLAIAGGGHVLTVTGDDKDSVEAGTGWSGGLPDVNGDLVYTQLVGATTVTLIVDASVSVNADILNP